MFRDDARPLGAAPRTSEDFWGDGARIQPALAERLAPVVVFVVSMLLYVRTLMPGMAFDDWGEMQTVPHVLGIAHPTGYPTYVLSAWLFELLPFGSIAFRANLFAAVCTAVALAAMAATAGRLGVRPAIAAAVALATGAIGTIWASAVVAEVNPLHLAFISLILNRTLAWSDERRPRDLALGGLLIGLSMGNHPLTAFSASFLALFALWDGRQTLLARPKLVLLPFAAGVIGISVYLYIPIAASFTPPLDYNHPTTWSGFVFLVTGEQFRGQYAGLFNISSIGQLIAGLPDLWTLVGERAFGLVPIAGLLGIGILVVRRTAFGIALACILIVGIDIWSTYLKLEHYLLVPWLVIGLGCAVFIEGAARGITRWLPRPANEAGGPVATVAAAAMALLLIVSNLPAADRSSDYTAETFVNQVFGSLPQNAVIVSWWGSSSPLWHAQMVLGERPDVLIVDDTNITYEGWGTREKRIASVICTRPVYLLLILDQDVNITRTQYDLTLITTVITGAGGPSGQYPRPLYRVDPKPGTCP